MGNYSSTRKLDDLHDDIHHFYLFKYLDLDDIWQLRLLSKRFYSIVKAYEIKELYFTPYYESVNPDPCESWLFLKPTKLSNRVDISKLDLLRIPFKNVLSLRYLKMDLCPPLFKLDAINKFTRLQTLEIRKLDLNRNIHLKLSELHQLSISINLDDVGTGYLVIEAPNLINLQANSGFIRKLVDDKIKFKDPLSIRCVSTVSFCMHLLVFKNLECLEIYPDKNANLNMLKKLSDLKNFKKLRIDYTPKKSDCDEIRDLFKSKGNDLKIVLEGVNIKDFNKINEYEIAADKFKFQLGNYDELEDDLNFCTYLNYDNLIRLLPYYQPFDLLKKYNNIQQIEIGSEIEDKIRLFNFIKKCNNLSFLKFKNSSLNQSMADQLPKICSLSRLSIYGTLRELNFEFIMKIPYLTRFDTDHIMKISNFNLNDLKYLVRFEISRHDAYGFERFFIINKKGLDKYFVDYKTTYYGTRVQGSFNFKDLVCIHYNKFEQVKA